MSNMSNRTNSLSSDKLCFYCAKGVVDATLCPGCLSPYHPACAARCKKLENGFFSKCCKTRGQSQDILFQSSSDSTNVSDLSTVNTSSASTNNSLLNGIIAGLQPNFVALSSQMQDLTLTVNDALTRIAQTETRMDVLEERVVNIEGTLNNLSLHSPPVVDTSSIIGDLIVEVNERSFRQKNFIIFGLPESKSIPNDDNTQINNLFSTCVKPASCANLKTYRLGVFVQDQTRPRPIKVLCQSLEQARNLWSSFILTKKDSVHSDQLKNLRITWDLTKLQLQALEKTKMELNRRLSEGETNLVIVHRRGVPVIQLKKTPPTLARGLSPTLSHRLVNPTHAHVD